MSANVRLPVTAVIAVYDREHTIERAIRSIQMQTSPVTEIIVVDDGSGDDTARVAAATGANVISLRTNGGAAAARNKGVAVATQPWIAFLDSDDEWLPDHLSTLWPHTHGFDLVTGASIVVDDATGRTRSAGVSRRRGLESPLPLVFPNNFISSGGVLVSRAALIDAGGFDETLRFSEDFDLWLRVLGRGRGLAVPEPVCVYHVHGGQKTGRAAEARAAQRALLQRYRGTPWWSDAAFARRLALAECELRLLADARWPAARFLTWGALRHPSIFVPVAGELLRRRITSR